MTARNLRILLMNYEFPPLGGGGATASAQIARHLARRGSNVVVLSAHFHGLSRHEERDGYRIHRVRAMRRNVDRCSMPEMGAFMVGAAIPALRLAMRFKPDIMHVFFGMPTGPVAYLVNRLTGIPYLISLQGGDVPGFMGAELQLAHRMTMPLTRRIWSTAGAVIANSPGLQELAQKAVPGKCIDVVPNGADLELFHPADKGSDDLRKVKLLFVGRLASQKGLPYLLQALSRLDPQILSKAEVDLVGSGPDEAALKEMVRGLNLGEVVRFSGWVPREEIPMRYREADVFVLPSLDEGMPNVMLEAMGSGNAIVATNIRGTRDLVRDGENGFLVPPADSEALTTALGQIISDKEARERMGRASRTRAERYSWASTADAYLAFSEQILGISNTSAMQLDVVRGD